MKGNQEVVSMLNDLLADELTAINQYMVHAEICEDLGYEGLEKKVRARAMDEMRHGEKLIERILFLEGEPKVTSLKKISIGKNVQEQLSNDLEFEKAAVSAYNQAIALAAKLGDNGTKQLLESILKEEEDHLDWLETQLSQIKELGLSYYLSLHVRE